MLEHANKGEAMSMCGNTDRKRNTAVYRENLIALFNREVLSIAEIKWYANKFGYAIVCGDGRAVDIIFDTRGRKSV